MPADERTSHFFEEEAEVRTDLIEAERLIVDGGIDAEAAGVGAAHAADHRHHLDEGRRLRDRLLDELPARRDAGQLPRLPRRAYPAAKGPVRRPVAQDLVDRRLIGEP